MRLALSLLILALFGLASTVHAAAPAPVKPVSMAMFSGRWYEIGRIAEGASRRCDFATTDFAGQTGGVFSVIQTCHEGSPDAAPHAIKASARILPNTGNAKIKVGFLGGLISQEYWILDHADDDQDWALMATPGGRFLLLMSRQPKMSPAAHQAAVAHISALGYDVNHLKASR
jgi:apolipoprotein D and lipocalin family protein